MNYPVLNSASEVFDTSKFNSHQTELAVQNGDTIYQHHNSNSYYEKNRAGEEIKYFYKRGNTKDSPIIGYDYSADPIFGIYKEFTSNGLLQVKGIYCWFGFNVGLWFYYDQMGRLSKTIDYDKGYVFGTDSIFNFCKTHSISLEKKKDGYATAIRKRTMPTGKLIWTVSYASEDGFKIVTLTLDASNGEVLKSNTSAKPLN